MSAATIQRHRTFAVLIRAEEHDGLEVLDRVLAERVAVPEEALGGREAGRAELGRLGRAKAHVREHLGIGQVERQREDGEVDGEERRADRSDAVTRARPERLALGQEPARSGECTTALAHVLLCNTLTDQSRRRSLVE